MRYIMFAVVIAFIFSCGSGIKYDKINTGKVDSVMQELGQAGRENGDVKKIYLVNVDQGCESCIDKCLKFASKEQDNPRMLFLILSSFDNTLNRISRTYAIRLGKAKSIVVDKDLVANKAGLIDVFPAVYYLDDQKVVNNIFIDASNIDKILVEN